MTDPSHAELVRRAAHWLEHTELCRVVLCEVGTESERVDAIGWKSVDRSIVVECKATRADFLRDCRKPHRVRPELGIGSLRWYLAPPAVIRESELPDGWGLLECYARRLARVRQAGPLQSDRGSERHLLLWQLVRAQERIHQLELDKGVLERELVQANRAPPAEAFPKGWLANG